MNLLSFDLETHLIQPGLLAPPIVCGAFAGGNYKSNPTLVTPPYAIAVLVSALDSTEKQIICGANIAYDFGCVLAVRPDLLPLIWKAYEEKRVLDVQIAASLNAIADGRMRDGELFRRDGTRIQSGRYSLDECVREWLGRSDAKSNDRWRLSYAILESTPIQQWPEDARQYPIDDARNTLEVAEAQIKSAKNLHDLPAQCHAAFAIHLSAIWGMRTDPVAVGELKTNVAKHIDELEAWAVTQGLMRPKSKLSKDLSVNKKALGELVLKAYDGNPPHTEKGGISTSRETLKDSGDPVLERFVQVNQWRKFETYLPTLEQGTNTPLNFKANVLLSTGRVSYDGLIQLLPRDGGVRECFVARPGTLWSSVDYAAIEMSTLAQVCLWTVGYSELADAINADADPHCILGADLIGVTYETFLERYKSGDESTAKLRQAGKAGNFGFPGMMGAAKFVIAQRRAGASVCEWFFRDGRCREHKSFEYKDTPLEMPLCTRCIEQAEVIRTSYLQRWKEVRPYWKWVMDELQNNDAVTQFVSKRVRGSPHGPAAANTLFQGLASDGAKRAVVKMTKEMYLDADSALYGSRLLVFSHDETIIEIPEAQAHDAAMRQAEVMIEQMRTVVPDVKVKAVPALQRRWYKKATDVYDANGKLIPWEPKKAA